MAFRHGKYTRVAYDGKDITLFLNEASETMTVDTAETSTFLTGAKTYVIGLVDGTVTLSGMFDADAADAEDRIDDYLSAVLGEGDELAMILPQGDLDGVGSRVLFMKSETTNYEISSPIGDVVSVSIEMNADGGIHSGVYLRGSVAGAGYDSVDNGTTEESTSVDQDASSPGGAVGQIQVTENTIDNDLDVTIQDSPDNSVWADLITFTTVATTVETSEQLSVTGSVDRYIRSRVVASGTSGSAQVAVAFRRL